MAQFEFFQWQNSNGMTIRCSANIIQERNTPWVIFCHGFTGQRMGPGYLFVKIAKHLADNGFSSLRFDFCGSGESDGQFFDMTVRTMEQDLLFVAEQVKHHFSPSSLILFGHSFGGMIASMNAGVLKAQGLILLSPVGNPEGLIDRRQDLLEAGANSDGLYENGPHEMSIKFLETLKNLDPVEKFYSTFKGNLLLIQGDTDLSISIDESARYIEKAKETGIDYQYQIVQGADHNFSKVSYVKTVISTVCIWTKEHFS